MLDALLRHLNEAGPTAAAVILALELLSRPRIVVKCVTAVVRYGKGEMHELWNAVGELRDELTHWTTPSPQPPPPPPPDESDEGEHAGSEH